jgi:phage N-6-adenine-methyltransferase
MVEAALLSSKKQTWQTPASLLSEIKSFREIQLDPCTAVSNPTGASTFFTEEDDGLSHSWNCGGLVYVNSPYGRELPIWVKKCVMEAALGTEIIMLLPARPDTRYWHAGIFPTCDALCFLRGRLKFVGASHPAPFPSALVYWGADVSRFRCVFHEHGYCI